MKFRNIDTGVVLEPACDEVARMYAANPQYREVSTLPDVPPAKEPKEPKKPKDKKE